MPEIHRLADVHPKARLAADVTVGPFTVIGPDVEIGAGTVVMNSVTILGITRIGARNRIFPGAVIGVDNQDLKYKGEPSRTEIGDANTIREYVTVHRGTAGGGMLTRIGNHNHIMAYSHVAHDCELGDRIIMANGATLAGHVKIEDGVTLGGMVGIHQFCTVGEMAYVGGCSKLGRDLPPYVYAEGNPVEIIKLNAVGLTRRGVPPERLEVLKDAFRALFRSKDKNVGQGIEEIKANGLDKQPEVGRLLAALEASRQGVQGRAREAHRTDDPMKGPVPGARA